MGVKECFDGVVVRVADWVFDRIPVDLVELCFQFDDRVGYVGIGRRRPAEENDRVGDLQHFVVLRFLVLVNGRDRDPDASETPINAPNIVSSMSASFRFFAELLPITASVIYHSSTDFSIQKRRFAWEQRKLGELAPLRGGFAFQSQEYCTEGVPIVKISNILSDGMVGGEFDYYAELKDDHEFTLPNGAAVLAMSGATTGKVAILLKKSNQKYYQNQRVGYFTSTRNVEYSFITTIVRSDLFIEQLKSVLVAGAQPNVSPKDIDSFEFSFPKSQNEQHKIGQFFQSLDRLITLHQREYNLRVKD